MRAALTSDDPRDPAVRVATWPDPIARPGWAVVRLHAAGLNRLDSMVIARRADLLGLSILGSDGAGTVVAAGEGVDVEIGASVVISPSLHWGDDDHAPSDRYEILGSPTNGTHAELVAVPAENLYPTPGRLTWEQAAALPMAGVTAWRALVNRGRLQAGETVIVAAASSGVGTFAIQIAAALGARVVAVSSSEEKLELARAIGADATVLRTAPASRTISLLPQRPAAPTSPSTRRAPCGSPCSRRSGPAADSSQWGRWRATRPRCACRPSTGGRSTSSARPWAAPATSRRCWTT